MMASQKLTPLIVWPGSRRLGGARDWLTAGRGAVPNQAFVPMVEITRGRHVESVHHGAIAVVDAAGRLYASLGDPKEPVFVRSSAKPFQALALVCSGAADAFGVTEEELAIVCASHSGEPRHIELVGSLMRKAEIKPSDLHCGIHPPFDVASRRALAAAGEEPSVLHNNCSGKHVGMLAAAKHLGLPLSGYVDPEHDVQIAIRGLLAFLSGLDPDDLGVAIDGCGAPTFFLPLRGFALAMARLAAAGEGTSQPLAKDEFGPNDEEDYEDDEEDEAFRADIEYEEEAEGGSPRPVSSEQQEAEPGGEDGFPVSVPQGLARVWRAMKNNPVLIAGSRARLCTDTMRVASHLGIPFVAKSGAEGFYAMALVHHGRALGIALKVEDGAERARNAAALETLFQLDLLPEEAREPLSGYHQPPILNRLDRPVGEVHARFRLNRGLPG
jgi:L-asparaginase II